MILNISSNQAKGIERGVYYFDLSDYPNITALELNCLITFIKYEKSYGRETEIICENQNILAVVNNAVAQLDTKKNILLPAENEFVYHATSNHATQNILSGGKLLSAAKSYGKSGKELAFEKT